MTSQGAAKERVVYKRFSDVLCFQLKRFQWSFGANKINSYFRFDLLIDMAVYTQSGKKQSNASKFIYCYVRFYLF